MKKQILLIASFLFAVIFPGALSAQEPYKYCGTQVLHNELVRMNPEILEIERQQEEYTRQFVENSESQRFLPPVYIVPVVFHILHQYGVENISDAQIFNAMEILNVDFRKLNADTVDVVPAFKSIVADSEIEFRLATLDPNGNCTNGIDRIYTYETNIGDNGSKLNQWPREKYLNIWVVNTISSGAAGFSQYPSSVTGQNYVYDGVMILSDYVGAIGTGNVGTSRALTHEVGHWLNLQHCWGSTNQPGVACGDDFVSDTPETKGWSSCNLSGSICNPPIVENVQNFMEYAYCARMFTQGQAAKMRAAITSAVWTFRANLWSPANLAATGALANPPPPCIPIADFNQNVKYICEGGSVSFSDGSYNGTATSWSWSFPGGTPSTSTAANPVVQYPTWGVYDVTLTVTNSAGSNTIVRPGNVVVYYYGASNQVPLTESFESISVPGSDWYVIDKHGGNSWTKTGAAAKTGSFSMTKNNFQGNAVGVDELMTPPMDLKWVTGASLTFQYAFALRTTTGGVTDQLRLLSSNDCGKTWTPRYVKSGLTLSTAGIVGSSFIPSASQWSMQTVSLASGQVSGQGNVRLKFEYTYDKGNNLYLDDININGTVGINDGSSENLNLTISPNPSTSAPIVTFNLNNAQKITIETTDLLGRIVDQVKDKFMEAGEHQYQLIDIDKPGVYFVRMHLGENTVTEKVIIQ